MPRLQKLIAEAGICSRRNAEDLIRQGLVTVNGEPAKIGDSADPERDKIVVNGRRVRPERKVHLLLHKPRGFITTASDPFGRKHVLGLVRIPQRIFPVGRLDKDASGLLLLTNDGEFANKVMHPRYNVRKVYEATLDRQISPADLAKLNAGIEVEGTIVKASAQKLQGTKVRVTIHTGIHKVVKRLFKALGYWVRDLKRTHIGPLRLDVKEGAYRRLTSKEIDSLVE